MPSISSSPQEEVGQSHLSRRNTPHTHKYGLTPHQQTAVLTLADARATGPPAEEWYKRPVVVLGPRTRTRTRVYGRRHPSLYAASDTSGAPLTRRAAGRGR